MSGGALVWVVATLGCSSGPDGPEVPVPGRRPYRTWTGTQELDRAGEVLDVSAVGKYPILVGAPTQAWDQFGEGVLFPGGAYRLDPTTAAGPLDEVAPVHYLVDGDNEGGHAVAFVGDLDADGIDDVAAYLPRSPPSPRPVIRVFGADLEGTVAPTDVWGNVTKEAEGLATPFEVCGVGDLDGDLVDDLVVGALLGLDSVESQVAVISGPIVRGDHPFEANVRMVAPPAEWAGRHLGCGGDLDGDGVNDLLVGADEALGGDGKVYLVSNPIAAIHELSAYPSWAGEPGGGQAGQAMAMGGDVDGDGLADAVVGAPQLHASQGRVYVPTDKDGGDIADSWLVVDGDGDRNLTGIDNALGDVDGDGSQDLLVGVPRNVYSGFDRPGRVSVFLGPLRSGVHDTAAADLVLTGSNQPDAFGMVLEVADVDRDGIDDAVVGAPYDSRHLPESGAVHLFRGGVDLP